jgi:hypothetical protein
MMTPAHFFGGYVTLQASKKYWATKTLSSSQQLGLLLFGLILSIAIDLDVLITGGIGGHHELLTHYPFFWLALSLLVFGLGRYMKKPLWQSIAIVTLVASWTHMALDLVGVTMGIYWLWPFSRQEFSVTPLHSDFASEQERWNYIMSSPIMWIGDSLVIVGGLIKMLFDLRLSILKKRTTL